MRMQDIKVGERYAYGSSRDYCTVVAKDVQLPRYTFRGVEIAFPDGGMKHVPAREIVCTWTEQLEENERQLAELEKKRQERLPYREAASELKEVLEMLGIESFVESHQHCVTINLYEPALIKMIAAVLRENWEA